MHWKIFTDAKSIEKAERVLSVVIDKLSVTACDLNVEPYHKGGFVCCFVTPSNSEVWSEVVLDALGKAQTLGRNWLLNGDIRNELDMWSNESPIVGVKSIHLTFNLQLNKVLGKRGH